KLRNKMGIVFQNPDNQFVGSTVLDDIAFGLENRCIEREEMLKRIHEYATLVKMEDYLEANPENLSGGQKQRVAIASVLAMQPDYLIFDEATSMLDPVGVREIIETMKILRNDASKTIITITHNIEEVLYAEQVIVMNEGKIIAIGSPLEILTNQPILEQAHLENLPLIELINHLDDHYKEIKDTLWELLYEA
ncbi:MAG: ATP-binding cassette domain-containing protein, partial [Bacilli bacterium]|nr:ATP-binding cassette domain-containing protein [Bacilli bacterium]